MSTCPVCGRTTGRHHGRCERCIRRGYTAPGLFCRCEVPDPVAITLFGCFTVADVFECGRCGRPVT